MGRQICSLIAVVSLVIACLMPLTAAAEGKESQIDVQPGMELLNPAAPTPRENADPQLTVPSPRYFPETGYGVGGGFLAYWTQFGGLPIFGYPLTGEIQENGLTVQYFERARFEWHPGVWQERYDVLLGRLGYEQHPQRQPDYPPYPFSYGPPSSDPSCRFFPMPPVSDVPTEVGYNVCRGFRAFWEEFGGLTVFGYPLSQEYLDAERGVVVQWFERARFEWHPGAWTERYDVVLGRLGSDALAE